MTEKEIEVGLKLCAKSKIDPKCEQCPFKEKGCILTLTRYSAQYIERLKSRIKSERKRRERV